MLGCLLCSICGGNYVYNLKLYNKVICPGAADAFEAHFEAIKAKYEALGGVIAAPETPRAGGTVSSGPGTSG